MTPRPARDSVLRTSISIDNGELDFLISALRRLEAEAARDEAREFHANAVENVRCLPPVSYPMPAAPGPAENNVDVVIDFEAFEAALMAA